eukprot:Amastigsp_a843206_3.p3 type:complete len:110 gc:universal Amastigsp_a843206_3:139-468(+)
MSRDATKSCISPAVASAPGGRNDASSTAERPLCRCANACGTSLATATAPDGAIALARALASAGVSSWRLRCEVLKCGSGNEIVAKTLCAGAMLAASVAIVSALTFAQQR